MNLSRRALLHLAAGPLFSVGQRRPNLIFIIADQHSGLALGCNGHPVVQTPNLDRFARSGVTFTHAHTAGLICAPSRASLDTGLHVQSHGVRTNGVRLRNDLPSIYTTLNQHDYIAPKEHSHSDRRAYLDWLRQRGYSDVENPIIGSKSRARLIPTPYRFEVGQAGLNQDETLDAFSVDQAIRQLEENRQRRFALWVQLHGSHDPYVVPAPWNSKYKPADLPLPPFRAGEYDHKPRRQKGTWLSQHADQLSDDQLRTILAHYYGMISHTDALVGKLLDRVSALGLDDNTVIVYTADHGDTSGYHRMFTKGFGFYEPAIRIPLVMRAPAMPEGVKLDSMVSGIDVLPTVLDCMGLPAIPNIHGKSLAPIWRARQGSVHDEIFSGQDYEGLNRLTMIHTRDWKLTRYDEGGGELYNLAADPNELDNLIDNPKYAAIQTKLTARLEQWDRSTTHASPALSPQAESANPERARQVREAFDAWAAKPR